MDNSHKPDAEMRAKVIGFSCAGFTHEQIAAYLDIDDKTLRKHYRHELDQAKMEKISAISNNVYKMALEGDQKMSEFVLKCQGKWSYAKPEEEKKSSTDTLLEKLIDKL
jgi:hypothetical protein